MTEPEREETVSVEGDETNEREPNDDEQVEEVEASATAADDA